jgi:hypothetical protein
MADRSIEAFEKAVALRPAWGDAHCQLAGSLWFSNPKLLRGFDGNSIQKYLTADDPVVQRVVQELNAAAYYGISEDSRCYFATDVNAIPGLEATLPAPIKLTSTPGAPTTTPAPVPASIQKVTALAVKLPPMLAADGLKPGLGCKYSCDRRCCNRLQVVLPAC